MLFLVALFSGCVGYIAYRDAVFDQFAFIGVWILVMVGLGVATYVASARWFMG